VDEKEKMKRLQFYCEYGRYNATAKKIVIPDMPIAFEKVKIILSNLFEENRVEDVSILYSEKGCPKQYPHSDYERQNVNPETMAYGWIYSFQGSKLILYKKKNLSNELDEEEVALPINSLITFRAGKLHGGAAYPDGCNYRLHSYLDHPDFKRFSDTTHPYVESVPFLMYVRNYGILNMLNQTRKDLTLLLKSISDSYQE